MVEQTLTLKETREVADETRLFIFDKPANFNFKAGQYVVIFLSHLAAEDTRGPHRTFSLSSAPYEDEIHFTMRGGESGFKKTFWQMKPGDQIKITQPVGHFVLPEEGDKEIVFLVGGIGITPVWSMLKQAAHDGDNRPMTLFYSNRFEKDVAFEKEIKALPLPHLRYVTVLSKSETPCQVVSDERGYICLPMLEKYLENISDKLYYIVGSPEFIIVMEEILTGIGVAKENIKKDPFTGLRSPLKRLK